MNRRNLLLSTGGLAGVLGLGGYHQRRRIKRWSEKEGLNATRAMDHPTAELTTNLTVTESHLETALADLDRVVENARDAASETEFTEYQEHVIERAESWLENAEATLEEAKSKRSEFAQLNAEERLDLLEELRGELTGAGRMLGLAKLAHDEVTVEGIETELDALDDEYRTAGEEVEYYASDVTRAIVAYGELDDVLEGVQGSISTGRGYIPERPRHSYGRALYARHRLGDVRRFIEELRRDAEDGATPEAMDGTLDDRYRTLRERTEAVLDETDFEYDDDVSTHATEIWTEWIVGPQSDGADEYDDGRLALATRMAAERTAAALSLEAFEDIPEVSHPDDPAVGELDTTAADVRAAKRRAVDELTGRLDEVGDDPLGRYLCVQLVDDLEWEDRRIGQTLDDVNRDSAKEWTLALETLRRGYLEIAEIAAVIPDVLAIVERR
ncbi:hypothetical protein ACFQDG_04545 [Natronoarchaeum mannanilyticum]|uniref:Uncharacterized protein n=1 Tax=Natronoarchaeum mannanilyticum TaxID=926360 RepID=A0AAV3TDE8_9EURY